MKKAKIPAPLVGQVVGIRPAAGGVFRAFCDPAGFSGQYSATADPRPNFDRAGNTCYRQRRRWSGKLLPDPDADPLAPRKLEVSDPIKSRPDADPLAVALVGLPSQAFSFSTL